MRLNYIRGTEIRRNGREGHNVQFGKNKYKTIVSKREDMKDILTLKMILLPTNIMHVLFINTAHYCISLNYSIYKSYITHILISMQYIRFI